MKNSTKDKKLIIYDNEEAGKRTAALWHVKWTPAIRTCCVDTQEPLVLLAKYSEFPCMEQRLDLPPGLLVTGRSHMTSFGQ